MIKIALNTSIIIFILLLFTSCEQEYVIYRPSYIDAASESKTYGNSELESTQLANTIQVFEYYNVAYKLENENTLFIPIELSLDEELLMNYTTKAMDNKWLDTHKVE